MYSYHTYTSYYIYIYTGISYYTTTTGNVVSSGVPFGQAPLVTPAYQIGVYISCTLYYIIHYTIYSYCIRIHNQSINVFMSILYVCICSV